MARRAPPALLVLLVSASFAGCVDAGLGDPSGAAASLSDPPAFAPPAAAIEGCPDGCFEPSLAVDALGRVFVTTQAGFGMAVSEDGGRTFTPLAPPPVPEGAPPRLPIPTDVQGVNTWVVNVGDATLHADPSGALWWTALLSGAQGIQVARSDDGGRTWPLNRWLSPLADPFMPGPGIEDRQWMGFAPDGAAYLVYSQVPRGLHLARSDDGGETWTPFTRVVGSEERRTIGLHGPPVADAAGRVFVPYLMDTPLRPELADARPSGLRVAVSEDRGETWRQVDAHVPADGSTSGWSSPVAALDATGSLHVGWTADPAGGFAAVLVSSPDLGATWTEPRSWGSGVASGPLPWLAAGARGLRFAWRAGEDGGQVVVASAPGEGVVLAEGAGNTHFTALALTPEGRAVVAWPSGSAVLVAVEA